MGNSPTPQPENIPPNLLALVRFLMEPFLESPTLLRVDCETSISRAKIWVRVAFDGEDKGRVFGRGGRNIQAIRTVLDAVARLSGYSAHLDIYGSQGLHGNSGDSREERPQRSSVKPRSRSQPRSRSHS